MTTFARIKQALAPFGIPFSVDFNGSGKSEYFTVNEAGDAGGDFGDDDPTNSVVSVQVHWMLPSSVDYIAKKKSIRRAIFDAGCSWPFITMVNDSDRGVRHIIFECDSEEDC